MLAGWLVIWCIVAGVSSAGEHTKYDEPVPDHTCACGWDGKKRIVNGQVAEKNEFPFMLAVLDLKLVKAFCGASIITKRHALTAAHCTHNYKVKGTIHYLAVISGGHNLRDKSREVQKLTMVEDTVEHEGYNTETFDNDIGLLILKEDIIFNQQKGPICLPAPQAKPIGILADPNVVKPRKVIVAGWGHVGRYSRGSSILLKTKLRVIPTKQCIKSYLETPYTVDINKHLCTFKNDSDSCQGDSGGPIFWNHQDTNRITQVALVSFGLGCADNTYPGVNTDVTYYMKWIMDKVKVLGKGDFKVCHKIEDR